MNSSPIISQNIWIIFFWEREVESEDALVKVLVDEQVQADARLGVVDVDGGEGELKVQERHLIQVIMMQRISPGIFCLIFNYFFHDGVIDIVVARVINGLKLSLSHEKCWPVRAVAEKLNVKIQNFYFNHMRTLLSYGQKRDKILRIGILRRECSHGDLDHSPQCQS